MKKTIIIFFTGLLVCASSCNKILDQQPKGSFSGSSLETKEGAEALVIACYSILDNKNPQPSWGSGDVGSNLLNNPSEWESGDLRSDDCYKGGGGPDDVGEYNSVEQGILDPTNDAFQVIWKCYYVSVARCNKALQVLNAIPDDGYPERITRIKEVKVLRGFYYMQLKKLFRTFPYIDENVITGTEGEVPNNLTEQELWDKIIADFTAGTDIPFEGQDVGRVNKYVAYSLLCTAHMFTHDYASAISDANQVINSNQYHLQDNLEALYSDPHVEHNGENIFSLEANIGGGAESNVRFNWADIWTAPYNGPYGGGDGFQRPSQNLVNAFKVDANGLPMLDTFNNTDFLPGDNTTAVDPRLDEAIGRPGITWKDYTDAPQSDAWARSEGVYGPYTKKKNLIYVNSDLRAGGTTSFPWAGGALNFPFIKISDIMLLKAEALVETNQDLDGARDLVNQIRERAQNMPWVKKFGDPSTNAANYQIGLYAASGWTQDYARKAVRFERRLELCMEGHRFFDLERWGIAKQVIDAYNNTEKTKRTYLTGATFNSPKVDFYPVPQAEIDISRGALTQDPNY